MIFLVGLLRRLIDTTGSLVFLICDQDWYLDVVPELVSSYGLNPLVLTDTKLL